MPESGTLLVAHVKLPDLVDDRAVFAFGLHVNLPLQAEAVEIIDHRPAEESAQRIVGVVDGHALDEGFVAIDGQLELRHGRQERRVQVLQLRTFRRRRHESLRLLGEKIDRAARTVLQDKVYAARGADTGNGRRREGESHGAGEHGELGVHPAYDVVVLRLRRGALVPRLERDEEKRVVGRVDLAEEVEADGGGDVADAGRVHEDFFHLRGSRRGAFHRRGVGQLQCRVKIPLVFLRQERRGETSAEKHRGRGKNAEESDAQHQLADGRTANAHVFVRRAAEHVVEPLVKPAEQSARLSFGTEDERGDGRTEGQRVEGGNADRDRDGHGKLLVKASRDSGDENGRDENRGQNERDGHDRTGNFLHGLECRVAR